MTYTTHPTSSTELRQRFAALRRLSTIPGAQVVIAYPHEDTEIVRTVRRFSVRISHAGNALLIGEDDAHPERPVSSFRIDSTRVLCSYIYRGGEPRAFSDERMQ